jgi:hypothetical protein
VSDAAEQNVLGLETVGSVIQGKQAQNSHNRAQTLSEPDQSRLQGLEDIHQQHP